MIIIVIVIIVIIITTTINRGMNMYSRQVDSNSTLNPVTTLCSKMFKRAQRSLPINVTVRDYENGTFKHINELQKTAILFTADSASESSDVKYRTL